MQPTLPPLKPIPIKDRVSVLFVEKASLMSLTEPLFWSTKPECVPTSPSVVLPV